MNKEDASATPAPAGIAPTTETETEKIQPVTDVSLPISEGQSAPTGVMESWYSTPRPLHYFHRLQ
jgi:hypothetical protein